MAGVDWPKVLDLGAAISNVRSEFTGDWYRDPWGWPELGYVLASAPELAFDNCSSTGARRVALLEVPKENWGIRPAVVLDIVDRIVYQALVDRLSFLLIGDLASSVFGWRLPPKNPSAGKYSHQDIQWAAYRSHLGSLAGLTEVALRTDIVSFFASIPLDVIRDNIDDRAPQNAVTKRLYDLLDGLDRVPERSGLPQRSTASAVLANMVLRPLDDILNQWSKSGPIVFPSGQRRKSFARWMDDIWLFVDDAGTARRAQVDLQYASHALGLHLNSAKTDVLEGEDVAEYALEIQHSAVDAALGHEDKGPLEELIDKVLEAPEKINRTTIKFMATRMRDNGVDYRIQDLVHAAPRMPHGADALALTFKQFFSQPSLQSWLLSHVRSPWAVFEWSTAQFCRMFPSGKVPARPTRDFFAGVMSNADSSLPLLAVAAQRLSTWDPSGARTLARDALRRTSNPHARRILALAALNAGETRAVVKRSLASEPENVVTLKMLEKFGFRAPKVVSDYAN
jgi:hypothetical protein